MIKPHVCSYKGLCYGKEEWPFGEVFLEKQWKSSLWNDWDWDHGTVSHLLGGTVWREDVPLLLSLSANHLGDRGFEILQCITVLLLN